MPSVAVCANADVPVDLMKNLEGFFNELEGAKFLIQKHLESSTGRADAGYKMAQVDEMVRQAKQECVNQHFGD